MMPVRPTPPRRSTGSGRSPARSWPSSSPASSWPATPAPTTWSRTGARPSTPRGGWRPTPARRSTGSSTRGSANPPLGFTNMHVTAWLGPHIDVPHLGIAWGTLPDLWFYIDYNPRSDLMLDTDALDKYWEPPQRGVPGAAGRPGAVDVHLPRALHPPGPQPHSGVLHHPRHHPRRGPARAGARAGPPPGGPVAALGGRGRARAPRAAASSWPPTTWPGGAPSPSATRPT